MKKERKRQKIRDSHSDRKKIQLEIVGVKEREGKID